MLAHDRRGIVHFNVTDHPTGERADSAIQMIYDAVIIRTIVDIPEGLLTHLGEISKREHISRAEAIRRAVAQYLRTMPASGSGDEAFGIWRRRKTTGIEYEDKVRED